MAKTYVLDTNVLIADPQCMFRFEEHNVIVPLVVLEELDSFKREMSERGRAARMVARTLDAFREEGSLQNGIPITRPDESKAGKFYVLQTKKKYIDDLPHDFDKAKADSIIVAAVRQAQAKEDAEGKSIPRGTIVLVTQDVGLRVKCDAIGVPAEAYRFARVTTNGLTRGWHCEDVTDENIDTFYATGELRINNGDTFNPNEYALLKGANKSALARWCSSSLMWQKLYKQTGFERDPDLWCLKARNAQQRFALDALLDDDIMLVTLCGTAGTGKTLMSLAAGLFQTADEGKYGRVLAARPVFPMGRDLGYLPGDLSEKLAPWMQPIYDNIDYLLNMVDEEGKKKRGHQELVDMGLLEIEALTYIRGRSIPQQYMIIDEAQNLSPLEVKTIITRAGEGTKIVLTGDPDQIDSPLLDKSNNGLSYAVEKFKGYDIAAHVTLEKGERSELATLAADIL